MVAARVGEFEAALVAGWAEGRDDAPVRVLHALADQWPRTFDELLTGTHLRPTTLLRALGYLGGAGLVCRGEEGGTTYFAVTERAVRTYRTLNRAEHA